MIESLGEVFLSVNKRRGRLRTMLPIDVCERSSGLVSQSVCHLGSSALPGLMMVKPVCGGGPRTELTLPGMAVVQPKCCQYPWPETPAPTMPVEPDTPVG